MTGVKNPRKYTGCNCYAYHRPRNTAQLCECECHEDTLQLQENVK